MCGRREPHGCAEGQQLEGSAHAAAAVQESSHIIGTRVQVRVYHITTRDSRLVIHELERAREQSTS
jgi:hypothetical protein